MNLHDAKGAVHVFERQQYIALRDIDPPPEMAMLQAELEACKKLLRDPRVRALFPSLPDGAVLASCSGDVFTREDDEPSGCPACGALAGCCTNYPNCPGNPDWHQP